MGFAAAPELVDFDAAGAHEVGEAIAEDDLLLCIEYTHQEFNTLAISDRLFALYDDVADFEAAFDDVLAYCFIDFSDRQLFEMKLGAAGDVQFFLTRMDHAYVVRVFNRSQGLFFLLSPDAPVQETLDEMRDVMVDSNEETESLYST